MDKYDSVIKKNILKIDNVPSLPNRNNVFINFEISGDMFDYFLRNRIIVPNNKPIKCIINDEVLFNINDIKTKYEFLRKINNLNFISIEFNLSNESLPVYNELMNRINWKHDDKTILKMTVDRNPCEVKELGLEKARGRIIIPEEKLLWLSDYELAQARNIDPKVLEDTDKLKYIVRNFYDTADRQYDLLKMSKFDKVALVYHYITDRDKLNIRYANEGALLGRDGLVHVNHDFDWTSKPYETYIRRKGICEGQARLFRVLLNNWDFEIDATTINGQCPLGPHTWLGVVIHDKLYYCCTAQNKLFEKTNFTPNPDELYPKIYEQKNLNNNSIRQIEQHIRSLKR